MRYSLRVLFQNLFWMIFFIQGAFAACSSPAGVSGQMGYNLTGTTRYQYCNNTNWVTLDEKFYAPIVHIKFDESSGNYAYDSVSKYHIEMVNSPTWQTAGGQIGGAADFSEASSQYGFFVDGFSIPGDLTYSFWMRRTSTPSNWAAVVAEGDPSGFWFAPGSSILELYIDSILILSSTSSVSNGVWMHVAITDDGTTSRLYINGAEEATSGSRVNFRLNRVAASTWGSYLYDGRLDDLRAYDHALSAGEIAALYNATLPSYTCTVANSIGYLATPVKKIGVCRDGLQKYFVEGATGAACAVSGRWEYSSNAFHFCNGSNEITASTFQLSEPTANLTEKWQLNESAGTTADNAVSATDGTLTNSPTWQAAGGKIGGALQFDGVDDYVSIPSVVLSSPFTFSFWMKRTVDLGADYMSIFTQDMYAGVWEDPNTFSITVYDGGGGTLIRGGSVPTNVWTHVTITDDGTTSRLYINGVQVNTSSNRLGFTLNSFGYDYGGGSDTTYQGLLDDVRVYSVVLTADEVKNLYLSAP